MIWPLFANVGSTEAVVWGRLYFHGERGAFMDASYRLLRWADDVLWWIRYRTTHRNHIINIGRPGYYDADELILAATRTIFFRHIELCHLDRHSKELVAVHEGDEKWFDLYRRWKSLIAEGVASHATASELDTREAWYAHAQKGRALRELEHELYMELARARQGLWT